MSAVTRRVTERLFLIATAFLLIATFVFVGTPGPAAGTEVVTEDHGVILISTGPDAADRWVRYYEDPTSPLNVDDWDAQQLIILDRCQLLIEETEVPEELSSAVGSILEFSEGGNQGIGLVSGGIGARTKNNCATSNGQISKSQAVTMSLGSMFDSSIEIDHAEIEIEGKQDADVSLSLDGGTAFAEPLDKSASDNGPDSGTNDNEIVELDPANAFTSITVSSAGPSKALVSIEGGGDGAVAGGTMRTHLVVNQTLFHLSSSKAYDGILDCGEDVTALDTSGGDGPAVSGHVYRGDNVKDVECTPILYTFQIQGDSVLFDFPETGQGPRFLVRVDWNPSPDTDPNSPPIREVDFTGDGDNFHPGVACTDGNTPLGEDPSIGDEFTHPAATPVCLAGQKLILTSLGWQQIQSWDVTGDPRWR